MNRTPRYIAKRLATKKGQLVNEIRVLRAEFATQSRQLIDNAQKTRRMLDVWTGFPAL